MLNVTGEINGVNWSDYGTKQGDTVAVGDMVPLTLKPGYELADYEYNDYSYDENGDLMMEYYVFAEKAGPLTVTVRKQTKAPETIPVTYEGPDEAFFDGITMPKRAVPGMWFGISIEPGYYVTATGANLALSGYMESNFSGMVDPEATEVKVTAHKAAWGAKLIVTEGEVVPFDDYFIASVNGDTLPYGVATVVLKNGFTLESVSGAIVNSGGHTIEGKELYHICTVIATEAECKVAVKPEQPWRQLAVAISNTDGADYSLSAGYYEDGTYYVYSNGDMQWTDYVIEVEDGYGVKAGADYTAEEEGNGYWYIMQQADAVTLNIVKISPEVSAKVADAVENEQTAQLQLESTLDNIISSVASGSGVTNGLGPDAEDKIQKAIEEAKGALNGTVELPVVEAALTVVPKQEAEVGQAAAEIKQAVGDKKVDQYLDISIGITVGGEPAGNLTETDDAITFMVEVADLNDATDYSVARVHDGNVTMLKAWVDGGMLCFQSNKFSTFAVVSGYKVIDVDRDKVFTPADAVALFRYLSLGVSDNIDAEEGNVVDDGAITLKDVTKLYQMANGK